MEANRSLIALDLWAGPPGAEPTVRGISLEVAAGEWLALTGPNGGGKTSLILALAGLWPARKGSLTFAGESLAGNPAHGARIGVVLHDPGSQLLQPTVRDELAFASRNLGRDDVETAQRAARWCREFGLEGEMEKDPATLSAGRQQLVLLAAALTTGPAVLLADEATVHMDPATRARVLEVLSREVAGGLSLVWATQDENELRSAHRALRIEDRDQLPAAKISVHETRSVDPELLLVVHVAAWDGTMPRHVATSKDFRLEIPTRGVIALEGPNGAGKSVLLEAVAGLDMPSQMQIEWLAERDPPPIAALQFPEQQAFEEIVADEIAYAALSRGMARENVLARASDRLTALGFEPKRLLERRIWQLASGEKRLVEVVAALIAPASLVLLDEPTAGLDPARRSALAKLVLDRASRGPILVAGQDRPWMDTIANRRLTLGGRDATTPQPKAKR